MALREQLVLAYRITVDGEEKLVQLSATERKAVESFLKGQAEQQAAVKQATATTNEWQSSVARVAPSIGTAGDALGAFLGPLGGVTLAITAATTAVGLFTRGVQAGLQREELAKTFTALEGSAGAAELTMQRLENFSKHADFRLASLGQAQAQMELFGLNGEQILPSVARAADALGVSVEEMAQSLNLALLGQTRGLKRYGIDAQQIALDTGIQIEGAGKLTREQNEQVVRAIVQHWDDGLADTEDTISDHLTHIQNRMDIFAAEAFKNTAEGPINDFLAGIEKVLDALDELPEKAQRVSPYMRFGNFAPYAIPTQIGAPTEPVAAPTGPWVTSALNVGPSLNNSGGPSLPGVTDQDLRDNRFQQYLDEQKAGEAAAKKHAAALKDESDMAAEVAQAFRIMVLQQANAPQPDLSGPGKAFDHGDQRSKQEQDTQAKIAELMDLGFGKYEATEMAKVTVAREYAKRREEAHAAADDAEVNSHRRAVAAIQQLESSAFTVISGYASRLTLHRSAQEKAIVSNRKLASMELQALVLDEAANELMAQGKTWAIAGAVHLFTPGKQAQGAAELAGAAAAGVGAAFLTGAAANTRARESELQNSAAQQVQQAGGTPSSYTGSGGSYGGTGGGSYVGGSGGGTTNISVQIVYQGVRPADAPALVQDIKQALNDAVVRGELPGVGRAA